MNKLLLLPLGAILFCCATETRKVTTSKVPRWSKNKRKPINIAKQLHKGTKNGNEALIHNMFEKGPTDVITANLLYQGQTPLHIVRSISSAKLLLKKEGNPQALNEKSRTPLWWQVLNYIKLYDCSSTEKQRVLIDKRCQQGEIISLLSQKFEVETRKNILGMWHRLICHYEQDYRLSFTATLPNKEAYSTMMRKLLLLRKLP